MNIKKTYNTDVIEVLSLTGALKPEIKKKRFTEFAPDGLNKILMYKFNDFHFTFRAGQQFSLGSEENFIPGLDAGFTNVGISGLFNTPHAF